MSGGKYLLGDYDTGRDKFVVTNGGDFTLRKSLSMLRNPLGNASNEVPSSAFRNAPTYPGRPP